MLIKNNTPSFFFNELPQLQPHIIKTKGLSWGQRFCNAQKPRAYTIINDWQLRVSGVSEALDGTILIPKGTVIDGASIPFPWFIAFITFGILRPSGILLTASIPHDFAFIHGELHYVSDNTNAPNKSGKGEVRKVQRHQADKLFYHIVNNVNHAPVIASISWLAVRLGWYWVKYNGKKRGGKFPILVTLLVTLSASIFLLCIAD
jgi:hypothetical protein